MGNICMEEKAPPGQGYDGEAVPSPVLSFRRRGSKPGPLTLRRFRSKSDFSLYQILQVSLLRESFIDFLRQDFKEQHVYFWLDVNSFNSHDPLKVSSEDMQQDAELICHKFLRVSSAMRIEIDFDTTRSILKALQDGHIVQGMFDLAAEKTYQKLKFDYMPKFMTSDFFLKLDVSSAERPKDGVDASQIESADDVRKRHLEYVLNTPSGQVEYHKYLISSDSDSSNLLNFWGEVQDYKRKEHRYNYRRKRAGVLIKRYLVESSPTFLQLRNTDKRDALIKKVKAQVATAKQNLFDELARMSFQAMYASSYRSFIKSKDFEKVKENVLKEGGLERTLARLQRYADGRNIEDIEKEEKQSEAEVCDFHTIRANNTAAVYFKRFLQHEFSDQNFTFLNRVQDFKADAERLEQLKLGIKPSDIRKSKVAERTRNMSVGGSALFQGAAGRSNNIAPVQDTIVEEKGREQKPKATAASDKALDEVKSDDDNTASSEATGAPIGDEADAEAKHHTREHSFRSQNLIKKLEEDVQFKAQFIIDTFVKEESPFQINLRADNRAQVIEAVESGNHSRNVFGKVEYEIQRTIKHDAFPRFKKSQYYCKYHDIASYKMRLRRVSVSQISDTTKPIDSHLAYAFNLDAEASPESKARKL